MKVEWSDLARQDVSETISFLEAEFGLMTASRFLDRIDISLSAIYSNPTTFLKVHRDKNIYKFVINKHVTLYYQIQREYIYLITFWQNSKDDEGLKRILS